MDEELSDLFPPFCFVYVFSKFSPMRNGVYLMQDKESAIDNRGKPYFMRVCFDKK